MKGSHDPVKHVLDSSDRYIESKGRYDFNVNKIADIFGNNRSYSMELDTLPSRALRPTDLLVRRLFAYSHVDNLEERLDESDPTFYLVLQEGIEMLKPLVTNTRNRDDIIIVDNMTKGDSIRLADPKAYFGSRITDDDVKELYMNTLIKYLSKLYSFHLNLNGEKSFQPKSTPLGGHKPDFLKPFSSDYDASDLIAAEIYAPNFFGYERRLASINQINDLKLLDLSIRISKTLKTPESQAKARSFINAPGLSLPDTVRLLTELCMIDTVFEED